MGARHARGRWLGCALALPLCLSACAVPNLPRLFGERAPPGASSGVGAAAGVSSRGRRTAAAWLEAGLSRTEVPFTLATRPVPEGRLTSRFGYRRNPTGFKLLAKRHAGVDWAAPAGTPVLAAGDGTVDKLYVSRSYGNYVRIAHANGFSTAYAHLAAFADGLEVGSAVVQGEQIGAVGMTGSATGNHLHFELHHRGEPVDPLFARR